MGTSSGHDTCSTLGLEAPGSIIFLYPLSSWDKTAACTGSPGAVGTRLSCRNADRLAQVLDQSKSCSYPVAVAQRILSSFFSQNGSPPTRHSQVFPASPRINERPARLLKLTSSVSCDEGKH